MRMKIMDNNNRANNISKVRDILKTHINKKVKMKMKMKNKTLNKIKSKKIMLPLLNNR
jgi:hypothetical protein